MNVNSNTYNIDPNKKNRSKTFMYIVLAVFTFGGVALASFEIGRQVQIKKNEKSVIEALCFNNEYQKKFQEKDYVKRFKAHLKHKANKEFSSAWEIFEKGYRKNFESTLAYFENDHAFTSDYSDFYFIPIEETEDYTKFYVFFTFTDVLHDMPYLYSARSTTLELAHTIPDNKKLLKEIYHVLISFYECDEYEETQLCEEISSYLKSQKTNNFIRSEWRFIQFLASKLELKRKEIRILDLTERCEYKVQTFSIVNMKKEDGNWNLGEFRTLMIQRW